MSESSEMAADRPTILHARAISGFGGGPEKTILNSPRFLDGLGYNSYCAYLHSDRDAEAIGRRAKELCVPFIPVRDNGMFDWGVVSRLAEVCKIHQVDVWHGHDYKTDLLGLLVRRKWPMRLVTTVHGWVEHTLKTPLYYALDRWAIKRYDQVICVSADLHEQCLSLGIRSEKCHLIHNGIDTQDFRRQLTVNEARNALGVESSGVVIGAMGRLSAEKGFDLLVEAVRQLVDGGVDLTLIIAGEGGERDQLQGMIDRAGMSSRIRLLGHVSDIKTFFQSLDMFVLSSRREGLPNVVLEAMALEVPVITTRVAGIPRLIENERNGIMIEPESIEELRSKIGWLANAPEVQSRLASEGRKTIEKDFSFADRMQKIADVYETVLSCPQ